MIICVVALFGIGLRLILNSDKSHEVYCIANSNGSISVFDKHGQIAIISKSRKVTWLRSTSLYKMIKISDISENFDNEYNKLIKEMYASNK